MVRAFERNELSAYLHRESGSIWEKYAGVFEHLSGPDGKPRIAFSWFWLGFFLGPLLLIARKSYVSGTLLLAAAVILGSIHPALFWIPWPITAPLAGPIMLRRFLIQVQESRKIQGEAERLKFLHDAGGYSLILDILSFFG